MILPRRVARLRPELWHAFSGLRAGAERERSDDGARGTDRTGWRGILAVNKFPFPEFEYPINNPYH